MTAAMQSVHGGIGNTPLVELRNTVPPNSARIVAKLEWANRVASTIRVKISDSHKPNHDRPQFLNARTSFSPMLEMLVTA